MTRYYSKQETSIIAIVHSSAPSLIKLKTSIGETLLKALIAKELINLSESLNITKNLSETQIIEISGMIIKEYWNYKPQDLERVFKNGKMGKYGKIYDSLDIRVISDWFAIYSLEREHEIEKFQEEERMRLKDESANIKNTSEVYINLLKVISDKMEEREKKAEDEKKNRKPIERQKTESEILIQRWMRQFDNIYYNMPEESNLKKHSRRFINRYKKVMDINEFIEYKMEQYERLKLRKRKINY